MIPFYPLHRRFDQESKARLLQRIGNEIDSGAFIDTPAVEAFEEEFASFLGPDRTAIAVSNGLDALKLALTAWGVGPGDEVIVPGLTFAATWFAVVHVGATPVPVDVSRATALMDMDQADAAITSSTRAIIPVHLYGSAAPVADYRRRWQARDILVLEDAAQAHGAKSAGTPVGGVGQCASFSFYPTKNLGALGDAGMLVVAADEPRVDLLRGLRNYGSTASKYVHECAGFNARMDGIQAAVLSDTLANLEAWNCRRREVFAAYRDALGSAETVRLIQETEPVGDLSARHLAVLTSDTERSVLAGIFAKLGIETSVHYPYSFGSCEALMSITRSLPLRVAMQPVSDMLANRVLSVPLHPWLTDAEVEHVCSVLQNLDRLIAEA